MHKSSSKNNQVVSVASPSNNNETKKRKLETVNPQLLNSGSTCTNTGGCGLVKICKQNSMPHTDVMKLGEYCFKLRYTLHLKLHSNMI